MVEKERAPSRGALFFDLAKRLGIALGARALWTMAVRLIDHH
jgi:hypothetical protein